ncbi:ParB N-terminal domain-containing protein [Photobacterium galatheae]|uniref:ParB-like N-terminal domain-containing protein n=1 Tax=Photobacterium galatheae TaxID=1654360 RepID=A0A066RQC1_9GAMM|nr:ParB N-terminal domain-containing protein [Photobacterium galatheae]KDM89882.1 hypothetical protein EA58_20750 [Photobacterium galatheae]MCM0151176.1 ParB N-terminal domain-containing protein [Photobacterium galatheae]
MRLTLEKLPALKPTEVHSATRLDELEKKVSTEGFWTTPIWIDETTKIVIDGHHRLELAKRLNLNIVPCFNFNYKKELSVYSRDENKIISHSDVIHAGLSKTPLGYKKTRHEFHGNIFETYIPLSILRFVDE